ncbi:MAG: trehalose-phosphatase [Candidatus Dormibacteraeota bacterium]|nr:trehalose-phosphatase [Candidatus Dormibacteraeota bacterium]
MADPDQAAAPPEAIGLLSELSRYVMRIAVISGRDTDALAARLPIDGLIFVGNHGLEERNGESRLVAAAAPYAAALERAAYTLSRLDLARMPGVRVERKRAGVTVHFRNAADPSAVQASLRGPLERIAAGEHLTLHAGRMIWELRPPLAIDKGQVLDRLVAAIHPKAIVYLGDDVTDADAFRALKGMAGVETMAVGVRSDEVPDAIFADCELLVDGVAGVMQLLRELRDLSRP